MKSVLEIETAVRQLPAPDKWEIARWLFDDLQEASHSQRSAKNSVNNGGPPPQVPLPDYAARRRRLFGDKVLPNMVLAAQESVGYSQIGPS